MYYPVADTVTDVATGAPLLVDVKIGQDGERYALAQGEIEEGDPMGVPAQPNTGSLVRATDDSGFTVIEDGLNLPASMQLVDGTAFMVTLTG